MAHELMKNSALPVPGCFLSYFAQQSTRTSEVPNQRSMPMNGKEQYVVSLRKWQLCYG